MRAKVRTSSTLIYLCYGCTIIIVMASAGCRRTEIDKTRDTERMLQELRSEISYFLALDQELLNQRTPVVIERLNKEHQKYPDRTATFPGIDTGTDRWGREIIIETKNNKVLLRSKGRDGVDNLGSGDDIQVYLIDGMVPKNETQ